MRSKNLYGGTSLKFINHREIFASQNSWNSTLASSSFLSNRLEVANSLFKKDLYSHFGCVNAIEFSNNGRFLVSGGDDKRVLVWNCNSSLSENYKPTQMKMRHRSNIFCLCFDANDKKIFSAGNDDKVIVHDLETAKNLNLFIHKEAIYGVTVNPQVDAIFATAGEDGQILLFDSRIPQSNGNSTSMQLAKSYNPFHTVQFHPVEPRYLVTANPKEGVVLWDTRKPLIPIFKYADKKCADSSMCARFNSTGSQIIVLRRRLNPTLFNINSSTPVCQFDADHYYNSCTMKTSCFAGSRDQYVLSGSDDFNLYMWKIPDGKRGVKYVNKPHMVLKGHRSIVNQVRFNSSNFTIASSGVEKIIKLWSPLQMPGYEGSLKEEIKSPSTTRRVYTHDEYIGFVMRHSYITHPLSHDYTYGSTEEDPHMMAFFDSLVHREVEGCTTDTDESDETDHDEAGSSSSNHEQLNNQPDYLQLPSRIPSNRIDSPRSGSSSNGEAPASSVNSARGSEWILRLIARKRKHLKDSKERRKISKKKKKKQKLRSKKYLQCITRNRSRQYTYQPQSIVAGPGNNNTIAVNSLETVQGRTSSRIAMAPYTIMAIDNFCLTEDEASDESGNTSSSPPKIQSPAAGTSGVKKPAPSPSKKFLRVIVTSDSSDTENEYKKKNNTNEKGEIIVKFRKDVEKASKLKGGKSKSSKKKKSEVDTNGAINANSSLSSSSKGESYLRAKYKSKNLKRILSQTDSLSDNSTTINAIGTDESGKTFFDLHQTSSRLLNNSDTKTTIQSSSQSIFKSLEIDLGTSCLLPKPSSTNTVPSTSMTGASSSVSKANSIKQKKTKLKSPRKRIVSNPDSGTSRANGSTMLLDANVSTLHIKSRNETSSENEEGECPKKFLPISFKKITQNRSKKYRSRSNEDSD